MLVISFNFVLGELFTKKLFCFWYHYNYYSTNGPILTNLVLFEKVLKSTIFSNRFLFLFSKRTRRINEDEKCNFLLKGSLILILTVESLLISKIYMFKVKLLYIFILRYYTKFEGYWLFWDFSTFRFKTG